MRLSPADILPADAGALLFGRIWSPAVEGPVLVRVDGGRLTDVSRAFPTARDLCEAADPSSALKGAAGQDAGSLADILANTAVETRDPSQPWLLSPVDLQAVKAAGVTFVTSMLERVIEERARGDLAAAAGIRDHIRDLVGDDLRRLKPGSAEAAALKETLIAAGAWSQYLEVGIGPDAEIFTKGQPLSSVGAGSDVGVHPASTWNNPEPEVVLVVSSSGEIVGAALGNDVNLRDVEGRSALLLGKAKDNNAAASVGPFIRLFDDGFGLDDVRSATVELEVRGEDGFVLQGASSMSLISRDPLELAKQASGATHQYPDGFALYLGTMFAPVQDRDAPGGGFTHKIGDRVKVSSERLGSLENIVTTCDRAPPWTMGISRLMRNLAGRGLLGDAA